MSISATSRARLNILMLVPHEPMLDPRIHYTAAGLATRHKVTVLATTRARDRRPSPQDALPYEVVRLPYVMGPRLGIAWQALTTKAAPRPPGSTMREPTPANPEAFRLPLYRRMRTNVAYLLQTLAVNHALQAHLSAHPVRPDLIYCHDLYALQTGAWLKQRTGAPLVYDAHEYFAMQFAHPSFVRPTLWYERKLAGHADLRLTVSPQLAVELAEVLGTGAFEAIPNAEPSPDGPVTPLGREMEALAGGRVRFLYQGNFVEGRGIDDLLREWTQVDGDRAALFLRGPENAAAAELRRRAAKLKLLDHSAYFLPPVLETELIAAAAEADVGIIPYKGDLPSYRFACPNKLSQYMHAGVAVLANDIPFVAGMVREHDMGWVFDVRRQGSLARAVEDALSPPALARCRENAAAVARTIYRWEVYEDRLLELIDKAAGAR